jgi:hypothetical protein
MTDNKPLTISGLTEWLVANSWPRLDGEQRGDQIVFRGNDEKHWTLTTHAEAPGHQFLSLCPGGNLSSGWILFTADVAGNVEGIDFSESYAGSCYASAIAPDLLSIADMPAIIGAQCQSFQALDQALDARRDITKEDHELSLLYDLEMAAQFAFNERAEESSDG